MRWSASLWIIWKRKSYKPGRRPGSPGGERTKQPIQRGRNRMGPVPLFLERSSRMKRVTVDFSKKLGPIKPMHSVNNGPAGARVRGTSNFDDYAAAGIPFARNHDASFYSGYGGEHTVDVHRIFPRFEADETNPASYKFGPTDIYTQSIIDAGTQVFYRLGAAIEHGYKEGTYPPPDFEKWARIAEHIILHYNEGWADGFRHGIQYWEIWNEPDCRNADGSNPCWQGTREQFIEFFTTAIKHLKTRFPELKIGGPAFCGAWDDEYNEILLSEMRKQNLPLDFFSFHGYAREPERYAESARHARETLDHFGYTDTEIILNEWNYIRGWLNEDWKYSLRMEKGVKGSSFIAASMICAQNSPMDHFMYYDARPCGMNGMFDTDTLKPLKGYYPFPMFNELYKLGAQAQCDTESAPLYALAAVGEGEAAVLVTHYSDDDNAPETEVCISMNGLGEGVWKASCYLLDAEHDQTLVRAEKFAAGGMDAYLTLPLFGSCLIKLEKL